MHEMALAERIVHIAQEQASAQGACAIRSVIVEVGALSCVAPEALAFCFSAVARQTLAEGAALVIETIPGQAFCPACEKIVPIQARFDPCPFCGSYGLQPRAGTELRVAAIEID